MPAAGVVMIVAVVLIVLALVYYLVSTILALRQITNGLDDAIASVGGIVEKSAPVADVVQDINRNLDAGVDLLEGLLVKKAGLADSMGLVEGLYPGAAAAGLRNFPDSKRLTPPRIAEVYTKGTLTLARLGREAPIAAASPKGPVLRNVESGSLDARSLYPENRQSRPERFPRSPVIGTSGPRPPPRASSPPSSADRTRRRSCSRTIPSSAARRSARRRDPTRRRPSAASTRARATRRTRPPTAGPLRPRKRSPT
jgi:hypothetical protein